MRTSIIAAVLVAGFMVTAGLSSAFAQEVRGTFVVRMPPGAYQQGNVYYNPADIAVPAGTTVVWFNDDPNQIHTVTSGNAGEEDAGNVFDSGFMNEGTFFQYTFDAAGDFPYFCMVHPYMVGSVSVSEAFEQGHNFKITYGTGPVFDFTEHERTLLNIEPTSMEIPDDEPVTYQLTILRDGDEVFSEEFRTLGGNLQIELVPTDGQTQVTGPDISDPVIGAYHIQGSFLKEVGSYTVRAEITELFSQPPEEEIGDDFGIQVVPEFPVAALAAALGVAGTVAYARIRGFGKRA